MAQYKYQAQNLEGAKVKGTMTAADEVELQQKLKEKNLFFLSAKEIQVNKRGRRMKAKTLADFCRQLGTLSRSGMTLVRALHIIADEEAIKPQEKAVYDDILRRIHQGNSLSEAMEAQNGVFPPLLIYMFRSAENSGNLGEAALKMASMYEKEHKLNARISASLVYPRILVVMILIVVLIITNFVLPRLQELLDQADALPVSTAILVGFGRIMQRYWYLLIAAVILLWAGVRKLMSLPRVRRFWHKTLLHLPLIGKLQRTICTARFALTLSTLYSAGVPVIPAIQIARKTTGNDYIDEQFDQVIPAVRAGNTLSDGLQMVDGIVRKLSDSVMVGEETGSLDTMLMATAESLEYDADIAITKLVSYIEPVMMIVLGVVVAFVLVAVFNALYGSYNAIAGMG